MSPKISDLFEQVDGEPVKCACGKDLVFAMKEGRIGLSPCPCGSPQPERLPDHLLIGPECGPFWIYPTKKPH